MPTQIGLLLGEIAVICLVFGIFKNKGVMIILGQFFLFLGLLIRPGALVILPLIIIWGVYFADRFRFNKRTYLISTGLTVVVAIGCHVSAGMLYGDPNTVPFSHYAMIFFGLVKGGQGYGVALDDLGNAGHYEIYQASWRYLIANPLSLIFGVIENYKQFVSPSSGALGFEFLGNVDSNIRPQLIRPCLMLLSALGVLLAFRRIKHPFGGLVLVGMIGFYLSIAAIPPASADEMRAFAVTMPFLAIACGIGASSGLRLENPISVVPETTAEEGSPWEGQIARNLGIFIVILTLLPPLYFRARGVELPYASNECSADSEAVFFRTPVGSHINLVDKIDYSYSSADVSIDKFRAQLALSPISKLYPKFSGDLKRLPSGTSIWVRVPYIVAIPTQEFSMAKNKVKCVKKLPDSRIYLLVKSE